MPRTSELTADFADILDAVISARNGWAAMLKAYFDESERTKGLFAVAGFVYTKPQAKLCAKKWVKLFEPYGGCHMTDLTHRQGNFKGISDEEAHRLIQSAIAIINAHATYGVAVSCYLQEIESLLPKWIDGFQGAYPVCCHFAMMSLGNLIRATGPVERVSYFFESGHAMQGIAHRFMGRATTVPALREAYLHLTDSFGSKEGMPLLQTADVIAWEWAKYLDETVMQRKRNMRRSLAALLVHGSKRPEPNNARMTYKHLTGGALRRFATAVTELGLSQLREEQQSGIAQRV